jgi:putative addiction module CopG family antidote
MSAQLSGFYKRIIQRQIRRGKFSSEGEVVRHSLRLLDAFDRAGGALKSNFSNGDELESLLIEGLDSGKATPMTAARRRKIYSSLKKA